MAHNECYKEKGHLKFLGFCSNANAVISSGE